MRHILSLVLLLFQLLTPPAPAAAREWRFDVHVAGFRFGEMSVQATTAPGAYRLDVAAVAQGFLGLIIRSHYTGLAEGRMRRGRLIPRHFRARSQRVFKDRLTDIAYVAGLPATISITPARDRTEWSDATLIDRPTIDPLSYLLLLLDPGAGRCAPDTALYDGRRRTRVLFAPPETSAQGTTCRGRYEITDGPDHSITSGRIFPVRITYDATGAPLLIEVNAGGASVIMRPARN